MESGDVNETGNVGDHGPQRALDNVKRVTRSAKDMALVPQMTSGNWPAVAKVVERAVVASTRTPARAVSFAIGVAGGFVLSIALVGLLTLVYPVSAPFALFYLVLPLSIASGLISTRMLPLRDFFTTEAHLELERAKHLLKEKNDVLDLRETQMRENAVPGPEIEAELGPDRRRANEEYFEVLAKLKDGGIAKVPSEGSRPKSLL
jgi:hypothetical protein